MNSPLLKTLTDSIPNLNESNISLWRSNLTTIFSLKGIAHWLKEGETKECPSEINLEIAGYILAKLDNQTYINCVKENDALEGIKLWRSIDEFYASSQTANQSRIFFNFLNLSFDPKNVEKFITDV